MCGFMYEITGLFGPVNPGLFWILKDSGHGLTKTGNDELRGVLPFCNNFLFGSDE